MRIRRSAPAFLIVALAAILTAEAGDGEWLHKSRPKTVSRSNPFAGNPDAPAAGPGFFAEHCAPCHGEDATGKMQGKHIRPNLHGDRVKQAMPGGTVLAAHQR